MTVIASIKKCLVPFCSSCDSASGDILVIASKNDSPYVKGKDFFDENRKPVNRFVTRDLFSLYYKSMDAYRGIFVLCTINGPCAWHQAIAGPFNNKNMNAKLICNFGLRVLSFSVGPRVKPSAFV